MNQMHHIAHQHGSLKPQPLQTQATFHRPRVRSAVRMHWVNNSRECYATYLKNASVWLIKAPAIAAPTFHRPRVGSAVRMHWVSNIRGQLCNIPDIGWPNEGRGGLAG